DVEKVEALFQELEFRRMAEQFNNLFYSNPQSYAAIETTTELAPTKTITKSDQFDLFAGPDGELHEYVKGNYNTLENTDHFYQIVQDGMGVKMLLQNLLKQTSRSEERRVGKEWRA